MKEPVLDEPVIVLTAARSGSTLLRLILDAHPRLACPPETNIVKICSQLASVWRITGERGPGEELSGAARAGIRATVDALFGDYLARRGKSRWCDKSLGTAPLAAWFAELYPKAKFICLYRHCMDVIHSGLEASPWGLVGYGFEQFAGARSGNNVSALAGYWIEYAGQILNFEREHADRCIRVHYERLVADPERVADEVFSFIGVERVPGITARCFSPETGALGPGDHKIKATRKITADSVGRGVRIPTGMILPPQLKVINHLLGELGYTPVDDAWQRSLLPPALLAGDGPADGDAGGNGQPHDLFTDQVVPSVLEKLGEVIYDRVASGLLRGLPSTGPDDPDGRRTFAIAAYHVDRHQLARIWRVDLADRDIVTLDAGDGEPLDADWAVTGDIETWLGVLAGRTNMGSCMRSGALRYVGLGADDRPADELRDDDPMRIEARLTAVRELLGLAGYPEEVSAEAEAVPGVPLAGAETAPGAPMAGDEPARTTG